jgi:5'-deoxynucleotidase YfbR-like HD superfamily hydrolase
MKNQDVTAEALYQGKAQEAKVLLVRYLSSDNLNGAYAFIADALAHAMTSHFYEEIEARTELQNNYFALAAILDKCKALKEAEDFVSLFEQLDHSPKHEQNGNY